MSTLNSQIIQMQQRLKLLISNYMVLKRENVQLKKEIAKKQTLLTDREQLLQTLQQQLDVLKLSKDSFSEDEKSELNKRIETYIKDIDRCLSLLNT
jgi:chromosome segregation ATPase